MLTQEQLEAYHKDGFVIARNVLSADVPGELQSITHDLIEQSRTAVVSDDVFDLDIDHTDAEPRLTRVKTPHLQHPAFWEVLTSDSVLQCLKPLIGNNIRLNNSKLNTKAGRGSKVVAPETRLPEAVLSR
ncbi:MAG: hypothetical protein KTR32_07155 [Granulosicoccus sp.]|nr:hypothetical protein [Granulosicoccus sp.]